MKANYTSYGSAAMSELELMAKREDNGKELRCEATNPALEGNLVDSTPIKIECKLYLPVCLWLTASFSTHCPFFFDRKPSKKLTIIFSFFYLLLFSALGFYIRFFMLHVLTFVSVFRFHCD